jgi:FKBP-type peptidyl-prolyl cis-trans isomerase
MSTEKKDMNIILAVVICVVLVGVLIFISIKNKADMPSNNNENNIVNDISNTANPAVNVVSTNDAIVAPTAEVAKIGNVVSMNYTGRLVNGTVFDSNVDPKFNHVQPFDFTLGAGQVISGWDKGIVGMKVGEKKTLTIAPEDAYGATGVGGVIPPNSTLIFDVELLAIKS